MCGGGGGDGCNGLTGPARCWPRERQTALRRGWEISTDNFVGSICTAPFVGSQGLLGGWVNYQASCSSGWSTAANPLSL